MPSTTFGGSGKAYAPTNLRYNNDCGANTSFGYNTITWSAITDGLSVCLQVGNTMWSGAPNTTNTISYLPTRLSYTIGCGPNTTFNYNTVTWHTPYTGITSCRYVANSSFGARSEYSQTGQLVSSNCGEIPNDGYNAITWAKSDSGVAVCLSSGSRQVYSLPHWFTRHHVHAPTMDTTQWSGAAHGRDLLHVAALETALLILRQPVTVLLQ